MTFDLYNSQTPAQSPDCRTSKKCSGDIGVSEKNSVENSPWGGEENPSWLIAYKSLSASTPVPIATVWIQIRCTAIAFYVI